VEDEGDFAGSEELGLGGHAAGLEGGIEVLIATDPGIQVAEGTRGGGGIWEIKEGKFGLSVGFDG